MSPPKGTARGVAAGRSSKGRKGRKRARAVAPVVDLARERRIAGKVAELRDLVSGGAVDAARTRAMLAAELEARPVTDDPDVSTSIRLPGSLLTRADALAAVLPSPVGVRLNRSGVLRAALERGLSGLEEDRRRALRPPPDLAVALAELIAKHEAHARAADAFAERRAYIDAELAAVLAETPAEDVAVRAALAKVMASRKAREVRVSTLLGPDLSGVLAELDALRARVEALTAAPLSELAPILSAVAHGPDPLSVACPKCAAVPGAPCLSGGRALDIDAGSPFLPSHPDRLNAARRERA